MSKYYGESERLLGKVFSLANEIPNGAIIFLDEVIDSNKSSTLRMQYTWESISQCHLFFSSFVLIYRLILSLLLVITRCMKLHVGFYQCYCGRYGLITFHARENECIYGMLNISYIQIDYF